MTTNPVIDCLEAHRSIRRFQPEPVPEEMLRTILQAGTRASTAGNLQLYSFLVIDERDKLELFRELLSPAISAPPLIVVALIDLHRIRRWLEVNGAATPVLHRAAYFMLGYWDALVALQNVVIAAESLGLGTCYFGAVQEFDTRKHFDTPDYVFPAALLCLGYPDEEPAIRSRLPLDAVLHRNAYRRFDDEEIRRIYRDRDAAWKKVDPERKAALRTQGIEGVAQAVAVQRFSDEATGRRSRRILENLHRAGFRFALRESPSLPPEEES